MPDAFICDFVRTPFGRYGGVLRDVRADDLAAHPLRVLMARNPQMGVLDPIWAWIVKIANGAAMMTGTTLEMRDIGSDANIIPNDVLAPMAQMTIARAAGRQMARFMGYGTVPIVLAPVLGPVIAGAILHYASWRWLFLVNLPVGALALVLARLFLHERLAAHQWASVAVILLGLMLLNGR